MNLCIIAKTESALRMHTSGKPAASGNTCDTDTGTASAARVLILLLQILSKRLPLNCWIPTPEQLAEPSKVLRALRETPSCKTKQNRCETDHSRKKARWKVEQLKLTRRPLCSNVIQTYTETELCYKLHHRTTPHKVSIGLSPSINIGFRRAN